MMAFAVSVLAVEVATILVMLAYSLITGISPVPTSPRVRAAILATLPARLDGTVFELGSGWGTLAFPLARRFPDCRVVAIELSPVPWFFSRLRQSFFRLPNLTIRREDFFDASLAGASLIVCYLFPRGMERLRPKFERELTPGTLVVSNTFAVPGWRPSSVRRGADLDVSTVYVYRAPGNDGGMNHV